MSFDIQLRQKSISIQPNYIEAKKSGATLFACKQIPAKKKEQKQRQQQ